MFCPDMLMRKAFCFLCGVRQYPLAFIAQRQVDRCRNLLPDRSMAFNLFTDRFNRSMRTQEAIGQGLVFAQKSQQQMFGLYIRRPELAGFIARKKDDAPCFLRITFEHIAPSPRVPQAASAKPVQNSWP